MNAKPTLIAVEPPAIQPAGAQPISFSELPSTTIGSSDPDLVPDSNPLHAIKTRLRVVVGEFEMSIGDLLAAKAGQVVKLDRGLNNPVDLVLEGRVVMRGQLVAVDGCFGVRVTELPVPLQR